MAILKIRLGKKAKFMFVPIKGLYKHLLNSLAIYGDSHKIIHDMYQNEP